MKTSIRYNLTNKKLFEYIFFNEDEFYPNIHKSLENMQEIIYNKWFEIRDELLSKGLDVVDADMEVTLDDFHIRYAHFDELSDTYIFSFPKSDYADSSSEKVLLYVDINTVRYYTLEEVDNFFDGTVDYFVGELALDANNNIVHYEHGKIENDEDSFIRKVSTLIPQGNSLVELMTNITEDSEYGNLENDEEINEKLFKKLSDNYEDPNLNL